MTKDFEECFVGQKPPSKIQKKDFLDEGLYPVISQEAEFINGYWNDKKDLCKILSPVVIFGDHTKVVKYIDFDFVQGADGIKILKPNPLLVPKFSYYQIISLDLPRLGYARHYRILKEKKMVVPPREEQQRIVAILDTAFADIAKAKANAEKNLTSAKELFESELEDVFSSGAAIWKKIKIDDTFNFLNGFAFKSSDVVQLSSTQLLRMGNLYKNELDLDRSPVFYPDSFQQEYARYILSSGDIVLSLTGTTDKKDYGYAVEINESQVTLLLNQRIAKIYPKCKDSLLKKFILYYLRSNFFLDDLYNSAKGTRQANLSTVTMKELPFFLPTISEQQRIVARLNELSSHCKKLEALYTQKIALYDELKQSLLQKAFSGEL